MSGRYNFSFRLGEPPPQTASPKGSPSGGTQEQTAPLLNAVELFPTRIWQGHLTALAPHFPRWVAAVQAMRAASPRPAGRTNRQGWNSESMQVLEQEDFAPLREVVRAACSVALAEMGQADRPFELQSWINLHDRGGFNFLHQHEGSLLSGSFYLQVPAGSGDFVFRDPRPGVIHASVKGAFANGHADVHLTPSTGLLVLFPCWIEHYVELHDNDTARITIAFNANVPAAPGA
jgi:uncharacterized protein (TIGR02466 family)